MKINPSKSKAIRFTRARVKEPLNYSLMGTLIPEASSCKYLGIILRSDLSASVPVQRCTLTLPIPLLPLWAVRPVQSLSACTTVHFTFTYTSTPPIGRTDCTEPQCLYKGALYLYLYLYSLYRPYGLYRASVPVQRCTLPLPIPLLPL